MVFAVVVTGKSGGSFVGCRHSVENGYRFKLGAVPVNKCHGVERIVLGAVLLAVAVLILAVQCGDNNIFGYLFGDIVPALEHIALVGSYGGFPRGAVSEILNNRYCRGAGKSTVHALVEGNGVVSFVTVGNLVAVEVVRINCGECDIAVYGNSRRIDLFAVKSPVSEALAVGLGFVCLIFAGNGCRSKSRKDKLGHLRAVHIVCYGEFALVLVCRAVVVCVNAEHCGELRIGFDNRIGGNDLCSVCKSPEAECITGICLRSGNIGGLHAVKNLFARVSVERTAVRCSICYIPRSFVFIGDAVSVGILLPLSIEDNINFTCGEVDDLCLIGVRRAGAVGGGVPAGEYETVLCKGVGCKALSSVINEALLIHGACAAVGVEFNEVGVCGKCTVDGDIVCGHRAGNLAPTGEGVALLGGCCFRSDCRAVVDIVRTVFIAVNNVSEFVGVYREGTLYGDIVCGHRAGDLAPTGEGVAFFGGCCFRSDCRAVVDVIRAVFLAVNNVDKFVGVYRECTLYGNIVCGHLGESLIPAGEGVANLSRFFGHGDCGAKLVGLLLAVLLAVHLIGNGIGISVVSYGQNKAAVRFDSAGKSRCFFVHGEAVELGHIGVRNSVDSVGNAVSLNSAALGVCAVKVFGFEYYRDLGVALCVPDSGKSNRAFCREIQNLLSVGVGVLAVSPADEIVTGSCELVLAESCGFVIGEGLVSHRSRCIVCTLIKGYGVGVGCPLCIKNILCAVCGAKFGNDFFICVVIAVFAVCGRAPTREGVAGSCELVAGEGFFFIVSERLGCHLALAAVGHEYNGIGVDGERTLDGDITCRHIGDFLIPAGEGVTGLFGLAGCGDLITELVGLLFAVLLAVYFVGKSIGVSVESENEFEAAVRFDSAGEDGSALVESEALGADLVCIGNGVESIGRAGSLNSVGFGVFAVKTLKFIDKSYLGVAVCDPFRSDGNIVCGHRAGDLAPTGEGVAFFGGCCFQSNRSSVSDII